MERNTIQDDYVNEREQQGRENVPGHYFHPVNTQATMEDDGTVTNFNQTGCQECLHDMKNIDIRRRIEQCNISLDRRNEARHTILENAYRAFRRGRYYRYQGRRIYNEGDLFWFNNNPYIDIHQFDGFRHNLENLETCQRILNDRITNPYYVFFFYPSNVETEEFEFETSEYRRYFHSSHPNNISAVNTISWEVETTTEGTLESHRIYYVLYFGDNQDDGRLAWNQGVADLHYADG